MTSRKEAIRSAGNLFILGFNGQELSSETAALLTQSPPAGVILFAYNLTEAEQITRLTQQVQTQRQDLPFWISVDQEGGRVQRCKQGFTRIPTAASIGATGSTEQAYAMASQVARELRQVGINLNFSPIADIATRAENPVIGDRSYGSDPELVSKMVKATVQGYLDQGVQPCVKHFPGHGDTTTDSHFFLPRVDTPLETLRQREFKPFQEAFRAECAMVMTAHIMNDHLDRKYPSTLSRYVLQTVLRKELQYNHLILSDDMEMKAIADHFGIEEAPGLAVAAGCDLLIYRSETGARQALESIIHAIEKGTLPAERVLEACQRGRTVKEKFFTRLESIAHT